MTIEFRDVYLKVYHGQKYEEKQMLSVKKDYFPATTSKWIVIVTECNISSK